MLRMSFAVRWVVFCVAVACAACSDDSSDRPREAADAAGAGAAAAPPNGALPDAGYTCTLRSDCPGLEQAGVVTKACCTPVSDCGYELPVPDEMTKMQFPQWEDFAAMLTEGDPSGRCAQEWYFFGPREGLYEHRVAVEGGEDILITPDCQSFTVLAFILPGCCLPDNTCGLSTDESRTTLAEIAQSMDVPFASPECVSAETLNQQFRDADLGMFARTTASGSCNHAELDMELPE
jgi:hypothetical protein